MNELYQLIQDFEQHGDSHPNISNLWILFLTHKLYKINNISEEGKEPDLEEFVNDIEITDVASNVGPNIARLVTDSIDALYLVFHIRGISQSFNK